MEKLTTEVDFAALKNDFDAICDDVNTKGNAATLCLSSGRKVFILPEENYGKISRFVIRSTSANPLMR